VSVVKGIGLTCAAKVKSETITPEVFLLGLLTFWALLYLLGRVFHLDKYGLEIKPAYLSYKFKRFNEQIESLTEKHPRFWRTFWSGGIVCAAGTMIYGICWLVMNLYSLFYRPEVASPVLPLIPGVAFDLRWLPYILIALSISAILHELAHGMAACADKISLKSFGLFLILFIFGAFTEPEEEEFKKARTLSKVRVYSAGPLVNLVTALAIFLLITNLYAPSLGILILGTYPQGPLEIAGLTPGDVIQGFNNVTINNVTDLYGYLINIKPNENLVLSVLYKNGTEGKVTIKTIESPENKTQGFIGLSGVFNYYPSRISVIPMDRTIGSFHLYWFYWWSLTISFSLAMFNMLPIYPFDGGGFLKALMESLAKSPRKIHLVQYLTSGFFILLLGANMVLSILRFLI
jgi:membrane-associated protease RseP (regulator of RpoE activity)